MQIRPENASGNTVGEKEHVVVVAPVNPYQNETQDVGEEDRQQTRQGVDVRAVGYPQLEDHDRDYDRDHAIAECSDSLGCHSQFLMSGALGFR